MEVIKVEHLAKSFDTAEQKVHAVRDISFSVEKGEIFGVIGLSGAGKSTLVRCLNLLERPDAGAVYVDGKNLMELNKNELMLARREISMIFQNYNLLMQRSVLDNVGFPLEIAGVSKSEARKQALHYLETVGLKEKANAFPAQLSGGQKQRVAIARALAAKPKIILCDEATSALDPETTDTILNLLSRINKEYGITIILITHEMRVVEEICNRVAVLDGGKIAEMGNTKEVFDNPKTLAAKRLLINRQSEKALMGLDDEEVSNGI
ncbi:MAG: ATP-binding cassette domain-containing protein [Lachnospiraceae bacterium]|nr:ATP-binding cassette domain-containing protein [Lachnospiraceae bacterium]